MAALHTITISCPLCETPIQCPVILTTATAAGEDLTVVDGQLLVHVRIDSTALPDHGCAPDGPERAAAAA